MITLIATSITSRTADLSWKHLSKTKKDLGTDAYYQICRGDIASLKFEACYEGKDTFCIVTDLKPATKYEVNLKIGVLNEEEIIVWSDNIAAELEFETIDDTLADKASSKLSKAVNEGNLNAVSNIISEYSNQINLETRDKFDRTLLMICACNGLAEIAMVLLQNGANALATTKSGKTALNKAVSEGQLRVAELLVRHEPRLIRMIDSGGSTVLMWACENSNSNKNGPLMVELLIRYGGPEIVHDVDIYERTAFDRLCMSSGNVRSAQLLLKAGTIIRNVATKTHLTHLMLCAINGHKELCRELLDKYSVDPKCKNLRGHTAHKFAEVNGHFLIAKIIEDRISLLSN